MHLLLGQALEGFSHHLVRDLGGFFQCFSFGHFADHARDRDRRSTTEGLKLDVIDPVIFDLYVKGHHIPTDRVPDLSHSICALNCPHIPGILEMLHYGFTVHFSLLLQDSKLFSHRGHREHRDMEAENGKEFDPAASKQIPQTFAFSFWF
jgi:hypothetical protein